MENIFVKLHLSYCWIMFDYRLIQMQYSQALEQGQRAKWNNSIASPTMAKQYAKQQSGQSFAFQQRYSAYPKSGYFSSPKAAYNMQNSPDYQKQAIVQNSQLRITISQLRSALQSVTENSQRLQQELLSQRQKVYELTELKRRLEDELQRADFELERISNYDTLQQRQSSIKLEAAVRENTRMAEQISDLMDESKRMKAEQRKLMSEVDQLTRERAALAGENQQLQRRLEGLEEEIQALRLHFEEVNLMHFEEANLKAQQRKVRSPKNLNLAQANVSNLSAGLQGPTHRSQHQPTLPGSLQTIRLPQLAEQEQEVDYQTENTKLFQDYKKLLVENESMKKLYNQFYKSDKNDRQPQKSFVIQRKNENKGNRIAKAIQPEPRSFSNHRIAQRLSSSRDKESEMFKTYQKEELKSQLQAVRNQAIDQIKKCYLKSVGQAESEKKNSLKIFNHDLNKNITVYSKLAENYLELRETVKKELAVRVPPQLQTFQGEGAQILKMYTSVKQKAKLEGKPGLSVAIFRLLTLLSRCKDLPKSLSDHMQHSALKFAYKLGNPQINE